MASDKVDSRIPSWVWPFLWFLAIFASSSGVMTTGQLAHGVSIVSGGAVSESGFRQVWVHIWWMFVKGWHATEFAIFFLLLRKANPSRESLALSLAALYAFGDEAHQLFIPHRGSRLSDVMIDLLGLTTAWLLFRRERFPVWVRYAFCLVAVGLLYVFSVFPFGLVAIARHHEVFAP